MKKLLAVGVIVLFIGVAFAPIGSTHADMSYLSKQKTYDFDIGIIWGKYTKVEYDEMGGGSYYCERGKLKAFILLGDKNLFFFDDFYKVNMIFMGFLSSHRFFGHRLFGLMWAGALVY